MQMVEAPANVKEIIIEAINYGKTSSSPPNFVGFVCVIISYVCGWLYSVDSQDLNNYLKRGASRYLSRRIAELIDILGVWRTIVTHFVALIILLAVIPSVGAARSIFLFWMLVVIGLYCIYALFQIAAIVAYLKAIGA